MDDTEMSQAQQMMRRVSPEGREEARRARQAHARTRDTVLLAVVASVLLLAGMAFVGAPAAAIALSAALMVALTALLWRQMRPKPVTADILVRRTPLRELPVQANAWLGQQRRALPAPAVQLADDLTRRLDELQPQLARLSGDEPAADAVRKLLATELPDLVEGYRGVPASLRARPRPDGRTPDAHLLHGLKLIDEEVAHMTEQLARGAVDEVATQGRYLELKYKGEGELL